MIPLTEVALGNKPLESVAFGEYAPSKSIINRLTLLDRYGEKFALYREQENGNLAVPRGICPAYLTQKRSRGQKIEWECTAKPRNADQEKGVAGVLEFLKQGKSGLFSAPTGSGKTVMMLMVAAQIGVTTLVVVHKDDLIDQWVERIVQHTNIPKEKIGRAQGKICEYEGKYITLGSLASLSKEGKYPQEFWRYFGLSIWDEVHRAAADKWSNALFQDWSALRLGASATIERNDNRDVIIRAHIGPERVRLKKMDLIPRVFRVESPWKCPRRKGEDGASVIVPHDPPQTGWVEKLLRKHPKRNAVIRDLILKMYNRNRKIVIFSSSVEHLETLQKNVMAEGVTVEACGRYYGKQSKEELNQASLAPIIFATFGKMGEGTDIPELDAAILTTPLANIAQPVGRILRQFTGKARPILIDIQDLDSPVFKKYANKRMRWYSSIGAKVSLLPWSE